MVAVIVVLLGPLLLLLLLRLRLAMTCDNNVEWFTSRWLIRFKLRKQRDFSDSRNSATSPFNVISGRCTLHVAASRCTFMRALLINILAGKSLTFIEFGTHSWSTLPCACYMIKDVLLGFDNPFFSTAPARALFRLSSPCRSLSLSLFPAEQRLISNSSGCA